MLYPSNLELKLGFDKIRGLLQEACESNLGKSFVDKIRFSSDQDSIDRWLSQTDEFVRIITSQELFPNSNYIDLSPLFGKIRVDNSFLSEEELYDVILSLKTLNKCLDFFQEKREEYPVLSELTYPIVFDEDLLWSIARVFDERGKLKDNASDRLYEIRKGILEEKQRLRRVLDNIISRTKKEGYTPDDVSVTIRNGRMVIPVLAEYKRRVKGFIHGESATGQTVYLEPTEVFAINNEVQELEYAEQREVVRILMELTSYLRPEIENLKQYMQFLGLVDFIRAKARFALKIDACKPQWSAKKEFNWQVAKHPLLLLKHKEIGKDVVPLNIYLEPNQRVLIISGPNAGGKSVCLKTVGLLQYMLQSGLLVSVNESSTFTLFKDLFIDIGDEQSIENDLSTYSSHLINMKHLLGHVNKKSLFLIDEFGTGTEPQYGGAIAEAILMELKDSKGMGVITTHYGNLKEYADKHDGLVNGAMRYDLKKLQPLYELEIGKPGSSFALEIAGKIGLPNRTIENAKRKIGIKQVSFDQMLGQLQIQQNELEASEKKVKTRERELDELTEQYAQLKSHLQKQEKKILNEAKQRANSIVSEANKEVERVIREIKEKKAEKEAVKKQRARLEKIKNETEVKEQFEKSSDNSDEIKIGDYVQLKGQDTVGQVVNIKGKDAELSIGELTSFVRLNRLEKVNRKAYKDQGKTKSFSGYDYVSKQSDFNSRIDLRGMRAEEVIPKLGTWLDEAIMLGVKELQIVHGKGNGVLRQVTRDHLKNYREISSVRDEHADRGGAGVTLLTIS
ncbi:endonuclease MutS2 [Roseivirga sp.]|uniref:endonuclease MutS2 n=1 Tax=Roseivirga sp. TaxID=1964215 RepID=UPI003B51F9EA